MSAGFFKHILHRPHSTIGDGYEPLIIGHFPYVGEPAPAPMRVLGECAPVTPNTFATVLRHVKRSFKAGQPDPRWERSLYPAPKLKSRDG